MNRREAIKSIALASAATLFLPSCGDAKVADMILGGRLNLDRKHSDYLGAISEAFLPIQGVSDKLEYPVSYILKMINDCHNSEEIGMFATGFDEYKTLMDKERLKISGEETDQVIELVSGYLEVEEPGNALVFFIHKVRGLSIENLVTSEYYMTEYSEYQLMPKQYIPCKEV